MKSSFFVHNLPPEDVEKVDGAFDSGDMDGNCNLDFGSHFEQVAWSRDTKILRGVIMIFQTQIRKNK
jgi:hypothetical protein